MNNCSQCNKDKSYLETMNQALYHKYNKKTYELKLRRGGETINKIVFNIPCYFTAIFKEHLHEEKVEMLE